MTAGASQPTAVQGDRRIIERPRLIKLLDEAEARTILLLAPAGYGKTTLARQWAKTLNDVVYVTLGPSHADVAWLAEEIAREIEAAGGEASRAIREHIRARANPQGSPRELGEALNERLRANRVQWVVLDDYHEVAASSEAEELLSTVEQETALRVLVASRVRPTWASGRRFVYGEIAEISRDQLAMTDDEATQVLGAQRAGAWFSKKASGWPAVVGLAARASAAVIPRGTLPEGLHRFLAEELFNRAPLELQDNLLTLALLAGHSDRTLEARYGSAAARIVAEAYERGFSSSDTTLELHPLLREFLMEKLLTHSDAEARVRGAIEANLVAGAYGQALELIRRFNITDLVDPALEMAYKPLTRSGRLATLDAFAAGVAAGTTFPSAPVEVVQAEVALRDGNLELARDVARRAEQRLADGHPLRSRAAAIGAQVSFLLADFDAAERAFRRAAEYACDIQDETDARYGLASASTFGEQATASNALAPLRAARNRSPLDLLRVTAAEINLRLLGLTDGGLMEDIGLDAARQALPHAEDPRARTGLTYAVATALSERADYTDAMDWLSLFFGDAEKFDLEFAMPYANWTLAQTALGHRRYGDAERALQKIEDGATRSRERHHQINAKTLRARLLMQNGEAEAAARYLSDEPDVRLIPSWAAEYSATQAMALACIGKREQAVAIAVAAEAVSGALEVRGIAQVARAIAASVTNRGAAENPCKAMLAFAQKMGIWDPVVCGVRSSPALAEQLALNPETRVVLEDLYRRTGDAALARRAGFRTRSNASPDEILSPREMEVLGLIARGYKNRDISTALFIAPSTTKVHVRHILEKLGVRTRAEAVARLRMFKDD